jgi:hypothetical protein
MRTALRGVNSGGYYDDATHATDIGSTCSAGTYVLADIDRETRCPGDIANME